MKRIFQTAVFCLFLAQGFSQGRNYLGNVSQAHQFYSDANGRPLYLKSEYSLEGTPYHPDSYYLATIILTGGKAYLDVPVKFNLAENFLIYKTAKGEELVATSPVRAVIFTDTSEFSKMNGKIFERGYPPVDKLDANTYYEVLDTGKVKLLKHYHVFYTDRKPYNSGTISRVYEEKEEFYIYHPDAGMKKLEKGCEGVINILSDKKNQLYQYAATQSLKCRKETDWKKLIAYYNSLP